MYGETQLDSQLQQVIRQERVKKHINAISLSVGLPSQESIKNYVEGRIEAGLPPTLKSIQSRLKGIHITCQDILDICLDLGFTVQDDDDTALSNSVVTIGSESDDQ